MPVPGFQEFMLPLLELAGDGQEHSLEEARNGMAARFNLTEEEQNELLPTAKQTRFSNRVAWAKSYLQQAGVRIARTDAQCDRENCSLPAGGFLAGCRQPR